jgi:hypothetical protein
MKTTTISPCKKVELALRMACTIYIVIVAGMYLMDIYELIKQNDANRTSALYKTRIIVEYGNKSDENATDYRRHSTAISTLGNNTNDTRSSLSIVYSQDIEQGDYFVHVRVFQVETNLSVDSAELARVEDDKRIRKVYNKESIDQYLTVIHRFFKLMTTLALGVIAFFVLICIVSDIGDGRCGPISDYFLRNHASATKCTSYGCQCNPNNNISRRPRNAIDKAYVKI